MFYLHIELLSEPGCNVNLLTFMFFCFKCPDRFTCKMAEKSEDKKSVTPDQILEELGGCGRYQTRMTVIVHLVKTIVCFAFSNLILSTKTPTWYCVSYDVSDNYTACTNQVNTTELTCRKQQCSLINNTKCESFVYDNSLRTLVSEVRIIAYFYTKYLKNEHVNEHVAILNSEIAVIFFILETNIKSKVKLLN